MKLASLFRLKTLQTGFTLIELLIVIAILGILTTAVLVSINPLEQFARSRDSGRLGAVDQLGHAILSYYTSQEGKYLAADSQWITNLQIAGEMKTKPVNPAATGYTIGCASGTVAENGYCYQQNGVDAIVYTYAESKAQKIKAACGTGITWLLWSSADGRSGLVCTPSGDPAPGVRNPK